MLESSKYLLKAGLLIAALGIHHAHAEIQATGAWVRLLPPNVQTTAAYVLLKSDENDRLLSVSTEIAEMVELHNSSMEDGMMSMFEVEGIDLPAGKEVKLAPHGYHMMVMGLKQPLKDGQTVPLILTFEKGGEITVDAKVSRSGP